MSWFGTNPFDETVERATSELLPAGQEDMALFLEICDQVRSKQVPPKDAARALRKRIGHKNPNVQLLALKLTDSVVKNGGHHFLVHLASREFIEEMESVIRQPVTNAEVKTRSLGYLQSWACAFQGKSDLSYVAETVLRLKADHFIFPEIPQGQSIMVDTAAPPDWTDSDVCMRCRTSFTMTNRKHHCRNCGQTFCRTCSSKNIPLPLLGINQEVRVCDGCYAKDWAKKNLTGSSSTVSLNAIKSPSSESSTNATTPKRNAEEEDEDLRRAIEASLKESSHRTNFSGDGGGGGGRGGYVPAQKTVLKPPEHPNKMEQDDPDLAAAIAASLKETSISSSSSALRSTSSYGNASSHSYASSTPKYIPSTDLSSLEKENISMFSDLVKRIHEMGGDVAGDRQVQNLYEQVGALQPKLVRSLEDAIGKHRTFIDLHEQISRAVKTYDRLLEERLSNTYASHATPHSQPVYGTPQNDPRPSSYLALGSHGGAPTAASLYPTAAHPNITPVGSASAPYPYGSNSRSFSSHGEPSQLTVAGYQAPPPQQSQMPHPHFHAQHIPQSSQAYGSAPTASQDSYVAVPPTGAPSSRIQQQGQSQYSGYSEPSQQPAYTGADPYPQYAPSQQQYGNQQLLLQQQQQYPHPAQQYQNPHDQQPQHQQQQQPQQQVFEPKKDDPPLIEF